MPERCPRCSAALAEQANYCARCGALAPPKSAGEGADPLLGRVVLGRYRVLSLLAEGGMGKVYLAEQAIGQATRKVALKALRRELMRDPHVANRFLRESEIVIRLSHPNTIQFYDFGQLDDGALVIVMEYIEGRTLAAELLGGPLPLPRVERLMVQICGSVAEAHALGIVHRDLKPQNVLLTERAGQLDFVKVLDFGIARRGSAEDGQAGELGNAGDGPTALTAAGVLIGTPPYMSPEQFSGRDVDARSDVYSLGVMAYELLSGALPFAAKTAWQWAAAHTEQAPQPLAERPAAAGLPEHCAAAIMSALEKSPERRPQSAAELLARFLGPDAEATAARLSLPSLPTPRTAAASARSPAAVPDDMAETLVAVPSPSAPRAAQPASTFARALPWIVGACALLAALGVVQLRGGGPEAAIDTEASEPRVRTRAPKAPRSARAKRRAEPAVTIRPTQDAGPPRASRDGGTGPRREPWASRDGGAASSPP